MFNWLFWLFGTDDVTQQLDEFEPIYGLPKASFEEWMSRNPDLRKEYDAKLKARALGKGQHP